ncbi:MAG: hypothetical protein JNJ83_17180 [Verrucomicrobiaceae bacterium]|nr:hypothetical protein [Verrucomicrobiaceae bacterium]
MYHDVDINEGTKSGLAKTAGWLGAIAGFNLAVIGEYPNFLAAMLVGGLVGVGASYYRREAGFAVILISAAVILKACSPKDQFTASAATARICKIA